MSKYKIRSSMAARVISESKNTYAMLLNDGREVHIHKSKIPYFVGDVVEVLEKDDSLTIDKVIKREKIVEKASNRTAKSYRYGNSNKVLASNVDQIYIFVATNQNLTLAKLERYALVFSQKDIELFLVVTKIDLTDSYKKIVKEFKNLYPDITILEISIYDKNSIELFESKLKSKQVGLFIGSSGAGKTTLINHLVQNSQEKVGDVRSDGKGKHTTTMSKMMYCQRFDYYVIDTPGFKGIDKNEKIDLSILFSEIITLSNQCKFKNCNHQNTPGCAVEFALKKGEISQEKLERYLYNQHKLV